MKHSRLTQNTRRKQEHEINIKRKSRVQGRGLRTEQQRRKNPESREAECGNTVAGIKELPVLRVWVCEELRKKMNWLVLSELTTVLSLLYHSRRSDPSSK